MIVKLDVPQEVADAVLRQYGWTAEIDDPDSEEIGATIPNPVTAEQSVHDACAGFLHGIYSAVEIGRDSERAAETARKRVEKVKVK